ncbi:hypothetical protein D3C86_1621870 [compost metagenome]
MGLSLLYKYGVVQTGSITLKPIRLPFVTLAGARTKMDFNSSGSAHAATPFGVFTSI